MNGYLPTARLTVIVCLLFAAAAAPAAADEPATPQICILKVRPKSITGISTRLYSVRFRFDIVEAVYGEELLPSQTIFERRIYMGFDPQHGQDALDRLLHFLRAAPSRPFDREEAIEYERRYTHATDEVLTLTLVHPQSRFTGIWILEDNSGRRVVLKPRQTTRRETGD